MSNITRRHLRRIIREETEIVSDIIQDMVAEAGRWMSTPPTRTPRRFSAPAAVDINTDTEVDEVPPVDEEEVDWGDPEEVAWGDDEPQWDEADQDYADQQYADKHGNPWDDDPVMTDEEEEQMTLRRAAAQNYEGTISEIFGLGNQGAQDRAYRQEKLKRRERAQSMLNRLKGGDSLASVSDEMRVKDDPLGYMSSETDAMAADLEDVLDTAPETKEEKLARLKAELQRRKTQQHGPPMYEGPIRETRKKKAAKKKDSKQDLNQLNTSGKYWYLGTLDNDHEPDLDWTKFGFAPVEEEEE
jgi:hypothetical protein